MCRDDRGEQCSPSLGSCKVSLNEVLGSLAPSPSSPFSTSGSAGAAAAGSSKRRSTGKLIVYLEDSPAEDPDLEATAPEPETTAEQQEAAAAAGHAKAHLAEVGREVARLATEVHGGMGFTDLLGLHYQFKRIIFDRQALGGPERCRHDAAVAQGWIAA